MSKSVWNDVNFDYSVYCNFGEYDLISQILNHTKHISQEKFTKLLKKLKKYNIFSVQLIAVVSKIILNGDIDGLNKHFLKT